jgi:hypothetical protein
LVQVRVQLPGAEHDLALLAVDLVAIDVDVQELVVAPQDLVLAHSRQQRPVVPQPQVFDGRGVLVEHRLVKGLLAAELAQLDRVEPERLAR